VAERLDGKAAAADLEREAGERAGRFAERFGRPPCLKVVLVGDDPASATYVRNKARAAERAGIEAETLRRPADLSTGRLLDEVTALSADPAVDGILVQLPLPSQVDADRVLLAVDPAKDVDGFHPVNLGRLLQGQPGPVPCTPAGILRLLARHDIELEGLEAVILGRSVIVGKPMALMLLHANATVTVCHSRTRDLPAVARRADLLISAMGRAGMVGRDYVKEGAVVVDVGTNRITDPATAERLWGGTERFERFREKGALLVGDVHYREVEPLVRAITPVPGGVGPMTVAQLMVNTVAAAEVRAGTP